MPITQSINSKANVKKLTNQDLPFAPQQPVMNSFYSVSTAGQTVINLSFSVDTLNLSDQFFLFVDGKKLRLGASNDYTFTSVASTGLSSQVTLNFALPINLNIQAYLLGFKKEAEFNMDNRFVQLYAAESAGFQGFIDTSLSLVATTTTGTPAAGTFYSTITKRTNIVDISQDVRPSFGIERIMTEAIYLLQTESGPSNELVWAALNDDRGLIRFVGPGWSSQITTSGQTAFTNLSGDYAEITFYGTGINMLTQYDATSRDHRVSTDGGAEGGNIIPASNSALINGRNYSQNAVLTAISGLTLGVHTVKIRNNAATNFTIFGFEVIGALSAINVNPGVGYVGGQKITSSSASSVSANSTFESGTLGSRGGHVVIYQKGDGTIAKAVTPTNTSQANLTSADHTNEELVRQYHWREFGAGRSDDFSLMAGLSNVTSIFTLDDDTTTLAGSNVSEENNQLALNANGAFMTLTFVGTGLDVFRQDNTNGGADTYSVTVDGTSIGNLSSTGSTVYRREKIVSGLPYGTHTVKILRVTAATFRIRIDKFMVHQPKKPSIPSGAIELADYHVMATYSANTTANPLFLGAGVLRKLASREATYVGTWTNGGNDVNTFGSGIAWLTTTSGSSVSFTFFGNAFDFRFFLNNGAAGNITLTLDGSTSFTGFTTSSALASGVTFTPSTGVVAGTPTGGIGGMSVSVSNLTLGLHTLKVTTNTTNQFYPDSVDVSTLTHSVKSNLNADLQNTLTVGSNALSDNRKFTPVKDLLPATKSWAQALGLSSGPTTTSTSLVPVPDLSVTVKTSGGALQIAYSLEAQNNTNTANTFAQILIDGQVVALPKFVSAPGANNSFIISDTFDIQVSPGTHKVDLYWAVTSGTALGAGQRRSMKVREA